MADHSIDILEAAKIELQCPACRGHYDVSLKEVLLSQNMLHQGCPVEDPRECPPLFYSDVADRELILELQRVWQQLEEKTRANGRKLSLHGDREKTDGQ